MSITFQGVMGFIQPGHADRAVVGRGESIEVSVGVVEDPADSPLALDVREQQQFVPESVVDPDAVAADPQRLAALLSLKCLAVARFHQLACFFSFRTDQMIPDRLIVTDFSFWCSTFGTHRRPGVGVSIRLKASQG